jgi:hypothetical protein
VFPMTMKKWRRREEEHDERLRQWKHQNHG